MAIDGEIIRVTLFYSMPNAGEMQSVFHYLVAGADMLDSEVISLLDDWIRIEWAPAWAELASENATLDSYLLQVVTGLGLVGRTLAAAGVGLAGDIIGPQDVAATSGKFFAATAIPKIRGRKFVPGIADALWAGGALTAPALADLVVLAVKYLARLPGPTTTPRLVPGVRSTVLNAFVAFLVQAVVSDLPGYITRRQPNVGS